MSYPSVKPPPAVSYPQATVIRSGCDAGKVAVEFGPRGPIYLLDADGGARPVSRAPMRGDAHTSPLDASRSATTQSPPGRAPSWRISAVRRAPSATATP